MVWVPVGSMHNRHVFLPTLVLWVFCLSYKNEFGSWIGPNICLICWSALMDCEDCHKRFLGIVIEVRNDVISQTGDSFFSR